MYSFNNLAASYECLHVYMETVSLFKAYSRIFVLDRILEFECNGIEISPGKTANCEVELWDCSGNHK